MKIVLVNDANVAIHVTGTIDSMNFFSRVKYASKSSGLYFLIAIGAVFIPVFHFILVPIFLIIACISFFLNLGKNKMFRFDGDIKCPLCSNHLIIPLSFKENLRFRCDQCSGQFILTE